MINLHSLCKYAGADFQQNKYVEGHRVYLTENNIFECGLIEKSGDNLKVKSLCLKTSHLRDGFHEIDGQIKPDGEIISFICSCPAGNSGQCKHIIGTLFYCMYKNLDQLSCTDVACSWDKKYKNALENYKPVPLEQHPCFSDSPSTVEESLRNIIKKTKKPSINNSLIDKNILSNSNKLNTNSKCITKAIDSKSKAIKRVKPVDELPEEVKNYIQEMFDSLVSSSIVIAKKGRHSSLKIKEKTKVSSRDKEIYKLIFKNQDSNLMEMVSLFKVDSVQDCCQAVLKQLIVDAVWVCEKTRNWLAEWMKERKYRVTGSICYELYTYIKNKNPDWKNKCDKFIEPKPFKTEATEYGNKFEKQAREVFKTDYPELEVVETGLIICQINPWLAFSPDGVVIKNEDPISLLEIKCPVYGKTNSISATIQNQITSKKGCIKQEGENIVMKEKHKYYGQIQMGMSILNVKSCYFVIHSSFEKKNFVLKVAIDKIFLSELLKKLKLIYYLVILPEICFREFPKDSPHKDGNHFKFKPKNTVKKSSFSTSKRI